MKPSEYGLLPTAIQYDDFQQWLKKQDSGYFTDIFDDISDHIQSPTSSPEPSIATVCRHTIHPVAVEQPRPRCPVCTMDIHLSYMKVLTRSLHGVNGRPLPCTGTPSEQQENQYLAWSQGKMSTLREVCALEKCSAKEVEWSEEHPHEELQDVQSATMALKLYWFEVAGCDSTRKCNTNTSEKTVVFAENTNFWPGRPTDYFLRKSLRYEPGKYTITYEEHAAEDGISEDSEDYSGTRVFTLGGPGETVVNDCSVESIERESHEHLFEELDSDDGDSDWEDIDSSSEDDEVGDASYICFEVDEADDWEEDSKLRLVTKSKTHIHSQ